MLVTERSCDFKGLLDAKFTLQLFEHKCVLEVCVHIHPIMIKSTQWFLNPYFKIRPFWELCQKDVVLYRIAITIVDWQDRLTLDPEWESWFWQGKIGVFYTTIEKC